MSKHSLNEALSRILKGLNHATIYSASKKNRTVVSEVLVYNKSVSSKISNRSKPRGRKINRSRLLKSLERRLKNLNKKWSLGNINSSQKERYLKQIRAYENKIEKLKREIESFEFGRLTDFILFSSFIIYFFTRIVSLQWQVHDNIIKVKEIDDAF